MCANCILVKKYGQNCTHFNYNPIEKTKFIAFSIVNKIKKDLTGLLLIRSFLIATLENFQVLWSQARKGRNASRPIIVLKKNEKIVKKSSSHR